MYKNIFDSHTHYTDKAFDNDRTELLDSFKESGICGVINCGTDLKSSEESSKLSEKYGFMYFACGIHPEEVDGLQKNYLKELKTLSLNQKCIAIGEIGLDYYWRQDNKELQKKIFVEQIKLANTLDLPIIVHSREASGDTLEILKQYKPKGVLHCFSGSAQTAKDVIKLGMYIGLGGAVTFKNARKAIEVIEILPLEKLLLETDCPYMAPVPMRGKRNNSAYIPYVAEKIAEIKVLDTQQVINAATENTFKLFNIPIQEADSN